MKKSVSLFFVGLLILIPCFTVLFACSPTDISVIQCDLNGGSFTDEYKTQKNMSSNDISKVVNLEYYGGFSDSLPNEKDLNAPDGKVFAGWYTDKDCTPANYLTSESWESFSENIKNKTGKNVIYARWINQGTKDILYEIVESKDDAEKISFNSSFISENTTNGNMTNSTIVRFNVSVSNFEDQKVNLPSEDDLIFDSTNYEFNGWKVENNGHYYDFTKKAYDLVATNNANSNVNSEFDSENFTDFFASGNEKVAYVLLRTKNISIKPFNKISIVLDIDDAGYEWNAYYNQTNENLKEIGRFTSIPDARPYEGTKKASTKEITNDGVVVATYYSQLSLEIRYDMCFENVEKIIPTITMFDNSLTQEGWTFVIGEDSFDFNETNWNTYAKVRPSEDYREIKFELKTSKTLK